eukprot:163675-Pyramimonas_sp.AAC.1
MQIVRGRHANSPGVERLSKGFVSLSLPSGSTPGAPQSTPSTNNWGENQILRWSSGLVRA